MEEKQTTEHMQPPLVTIVTPSYNQGRFIRQTIESVLNQDYPHIEYIVMDGGSTDETATIAGDYSSRLTFISERDRGQSHAINKGFQMGRGSIVAWINSDDVLLPGAVATAVDHLQQNEGVGAVYGEGFLMDEHGNFKARFPYTRPFDLWRLTHVSDYILQQSVFFRRDAVKEVGWVRENLHYTMDWDLLIRIGKRYGLRRIPHYLGAIREYGDTKTASGGKLRVREIRDILREHTGMRVPPGWILYGLDTYANMLCRKIDSGMPESFRRLSEFLQMSVMNLCATIISKTVWKGQGWYSDGWVGPSMEYWLPHGAGHLLIEGELPPSPWLQDQRLAIYAQGTLTASYSVVPGAFRVATSLSKPPDGEPLRLRVECSKTFVPGYSWENNLDERQLGFLLHRMRWKGIDFYPPDKDPEFSVDGPSDSQASTRPTKGATATAG